MARRIVMLCTSGRGGMLSVVERYQQDGVFKRWDIRLLSPHCEGALWRRLLAALTALMSFSGELLLNRVSLLHCHVAMAGSFWRKSLFALLARTRGVPVVFHLHGSDLKPWYAAQPQWRKNWIRRVLEQCAAVLVLSESWRGFVLDIAPAARVTVLHNYVDLPAEPLRQWQQGRVTLLFLGLVGLRKGIFDLLPAFKQALAACPELFLQIGGNGEIEAAKRQAAELGIASQVEFAGWVDGARKEALLAGADIVVLPSYNEGMPISLMEAMGWALPVISTTVGGIPELVRDGEDGLLYEAGDIDALCQAIL
ncbi:glycosyltransferase family 4 protein, partial [Craterilacuibacter sp.]|uniref:glycosyltransferase family 4 protein n=1 Tax=Craterilacuibacter sp. TaxID=2870909 RepID=UPI003F2D3390